MQAQVVCELRPGAHVAVPVDRVWQVVELASLVQVPLAPPAVRGIMNHNGGIVTVIDPAPLMHLAEARQSMSQALVLRAPERRRGHLGLGVLRVLEICTPQNLQAVNAVGGPHVTFVARLRQTLVHGIDVDALLKALGEQFDAVRKPPVRSEQ